MKKESGSDRAAKFILDHLSSTWSERVDSVFEGTGLTCTDCGAGMVRKYDDLNGHFYWECPSCNNWVLESELEDGYFFDAADYYDTWKK